MADIRKRTGSKGTTYQVRYPSKATANGYAYKTFLTLKEARAFLDQGVTKLNNARRHDLKSIESAIQRWLDTCEREGRQGNDPVSPATFEVYMYRAEIMRAYGWDKELHELEAPDIVAFRSWLLKNYSRDQAKKVLSSFHSVLLEMVTQGALANDPAARITVQQSRYQEPVVIPSVEEVQTILRAADALASDKNFWIAKAWQRYRPMIYLVADSGMRPQEYLAIPDSDVLEKGVRITQALDRSNRIGPPKSRAGRRYIPVGAETLEMVRAYQKGRTGPNKNGLVFPGETGTHQRYNNYLRRGWHVLMQNASMLDEHSVDDQGAVSRLHRAHRAAAGSIGAAARRRLPRQEGPSGRPARALPCRLVAHRRGTEESPPHRLRPREADDGHA
jgi:integrase